MPSGYPKLFFYNQGILYNYDHKRSSTKVGQVSTPAILKTLIYQFKLKP